VAAGLVILANIFANGEIVLRQRNNQCVVHVDLLLREAAPSDDKAGAHFCIKPKAWNRFIHTSKYRLSQLNFGSFTEPMAGASDALSEALENQEN
jgi:hypothetical protein